MKVIAHIHNEFPEKFGIPRQSGIVEDLKGKIVFTSEYRRSEAVRGLEEFSHIWLLWAFAQEETKPWSPTVRPPRLGGNRRLGVFATRSPNRPNPIGLSCVRLERVEIETSEGPVLYVRGGDLMDGTPIYDIKPYLPYTDCRNDAFGGFADQPPDEKLEVSYLPESISILSSQEREILTALLAQDPRPAYQRDPQRLYGMTYANLEIHFQVDGNLLTVCEIKKINPKS